MIIKKDFFIASFLKMIEKNLDNFLTEKEDLEDEYLRHASIITCEQLKHLSESL